MNQQNLDKLSLRFHKIDENLFLGNKFFENNLILIKNKKKELKKF